MVFNGPDENGISRYNLRARYPGPPPNYDLFLFIGATNKDLRGAPVLIPSNSYGGFGFSYDWESTLSAEKASVGFGIYKFEVSIPNQWVDTFTVEWDYEHRNSPGCFGHDLYLAYYNNPRRVTFKWAPDNPPCEDPAELEVSHPWFNRKIEAWRQPYWDGEILRLRTRPKDIGLNVFIYDGSHSMPFPQDSRRDCYLPLDLDYDERQCFISDLGGVLSNFLSIRISVTTPLNFVKDPSHNCIVGQQEYQYYAKGITVLPAVNLVPNAILEIYNNMRLTFNAYSNWTNAATLTIKGASIVDDAGELRILSGAELRVKAKSTFHIEKNSNIHFISSTNQPLPKILLETGSKLCNQGAYFSGYGEYIIQPGVVRCIPSPSDFVFKDSVQVILQDSAEWEINDSSTVTFEGNVTSLTLKPNSKIKFGKNSKLIFKSGAHIKADSSVFTSLNTGDTWNGIYLQDVSNDTIKYCTIENAATGVNIINKSSGTPVQPSTEISNCTFSNITTTQFTNGIYVSNSNNILFRYNTFTSSQINNGFGTGVNIEYSPPGSFNILDNTINKVVTGITVIQSSPYIARNTITGQTGTGKGFNLDNSNGTIEYNTVNNFQYSLYALYSSPYLLKNTYNNASTRNIDLYSNSIPVMRPIQSGSILYWLGGDDRLTGNPTGGGIGFSSDAYPSMDQGYNSITLNSGANYMNGTIPSSLDGSLSATLNYWGDAVPVPAKFVISGGVVVYTPYHDGSPPPPTDGYQLNSIGFGLYDTVFTKNLGDNSSAEEIFIQAYTMERLSQYLEAINLYRQVIILFPRSTYAPVALSRIFNCAERKRYTTAEYTLLENYFRLIQNSLQLTAQLRELAEDFVIKSKVRQGRLNDAIADYTTMYQQNQNNTKGQHALINKQCLIRMRDNNYGGQSPNGFMLTQQDNPNQTNNNIPKEYNLYQNYPNPFNPITQIKYDLPKDEFVRIKLYNLLGEEVALLVNELKNAGSHNVVFDGTNFASGLYIYHIEAGNFVENKKLVLIK